MNHTSVTSSIESRRTAVWRYLLHLGVEQDAAADLTQAALATWWEKRDQVGDQQVGAYLRSTARNLWRNHLRAVGRSLEVTWADQVDALWARGPEPDVRLARLRLCVDGLEGRAKLAIEGFYMEGLSRQALADRLGMSLDGVKTLLRRTRASLAACVRKQDELREP